MILQFTESELTVINLVIGSLILFISSILQQKHLKYLNMSNLFKIFLYKFIKNKKKCYLLDSKVKKIILNLYFFFNMQGLLPIKMASGRQKGYKIILLFWNNN